MKALAALAVLSLGSCSLVPHRTITACADPNNLPFSNKAGEGFENKEQLVAAMEGNMVLDPQRQRVAN